MATKLLWEELLGIFKGRVPLKWKIKFNKGGLNLNSATLTEFMDTCVCLEELEMCKPVHRKKAHTKKEKDNKKHLERKGKHHEKCSKMGKCSKKYHKGGH
eukprot:5701378-Ditylum_brightwellii.AAC.1